MSLYSALGGAPETEKPHALKAPKAKGAMSSQAMISNYVLYVINIMEKIGLAPLEGMMDTEAKLAEVTEKLQADLTELQEYISKIENLSRSGGSYLMGSDIYLPLTSGPNGSNGLSYNEFHEDPSVGGIDGEYVANDLKIATENFMAAFKDIFEGQPRQGANDPLASSNFTRFSVDKYDSTTGTTKTQSFDLSSIWTSLSTVPSGWAIIGMSSKGAGSAFSDSTKFRASLLQQYAYYKYKFAAEQHAGPISDISDLGVDFTAGGSDTDSIAKSLYTMLIGFGTTVTTQRYQNGCDNNGRFSNVSENFLNYIFSSKIGQHDATGSGWDTHFGYVAGENYVDIIGAFSYAAFNYFWNKNPNATTDQDKSFYPSPEAPTGKYGKATISWNSTKGKAGTDVLSLFYSDSQSTGSLISSTSNEMATTMQQYTSQVTQYQNIGQNLIKANQEELAAMVQNFKG